MGPADKSIGPAQSEMLPHQPLTSTQSRQPEQKNGSFELKRSGCDKIELKRLEYDEYRPWLKPERVTASSASASYIWS